MGEAFGREIASSSFNGYRRSTLEKRIIPLDVRGEPRAEPPNPLKENGSWPNTIGLTVLGSAIHGKKGMVLFQSSGRTAMMGYARHGKQCKA